MSPTPRSGLRFTQNRVEEAAARVLDQAQPLIVDPPDLLAPLDERDGVKVITDEHPQESVGWTDDSWKHHLFNLNPKHDYEAGTYQDAIDAYRSALERANLETAQAVDQALARDTRIVELTNAYALLDANAAGFQARISSLETQLANLARTAIWEVTIGAAGRVMVAASSPEEALEKCRARHAGDTITGVKTSGIQLVI